MSKEIITVVGATGTQGQSVVNALLKKGEYVVRGITRNPDAPAAKALKDKGVEVVSASLIDKSSLINAFEGSYAVFGVTVPFTSDGEELQGHNIVDAAAAAKVPLLIWSSLPSSTKLSGGKYIPPFDDKNAIDKYIATTGQPTVTLYAGWYTENTLAGQVLRPDPSDHNKWDFVCPFVPEAKISTLWVEADFGNAVVAVVDHWADESWRPKLTKEPIIVAPFEITPGEMVNTLNKLTGKQFEFVPKTDVPGGVWQIMKKFFDEGFCRFSDQSDILEEL